MALPRVGISWCLLALTGTLIVGSTAQSCSVPDWFVQPSGGNVHSYTWDGTTNFTQEYGSTSLVFKAFLEETNGPGFIFLGDTVDLIRINFNSRQDLMFYPALVKSNPRAVNPSYPVEIYVELASNSIATVTGYDSILSDVQAAVFQEQPITLKAVIVLTYRCLTRSGRSQTSTYQFILFIGTDEMIGVVNFAEVDMRPGSKTIVTTDADSHNVVPVAFSDDESYVLGRTNFRNPGQWMFYLSTKAFFPYLPPVLDSITAWTPWKCLACGGCGTRERTLQGSKEYDHGACGKRKICVRGRHSPRERSVRSFRKPWRLVTRARKCCYDYRRNSKPKSRPKLCKALGGWRKMMTTYP